MYVCIDFYFSGFFLMRRHTHIEFSFSILGLSSVKRRTQSLQHNSKDAPPSKSEEKLELEKRMISKGFVIRVTAVVVKILFMVSLEI